MFKIYKAKNGTEQFIVNLETGDAVEVVALIDLSRLDLPMPIRVIEPTTSLKNRKKVTRKASVKAIKTVQVDQGDEVKKRKYQKRNKAVINKFECMDCWNEFTSTEDFGDTICPECKSKNLVQK